MGVTAWRAVWFNLMATAYECAGGQAQSQEGRSPFRLSKGRGCGEGGASYLWVVSQVDLSGDVVYGTYPLWREDIKKSAGAQSLGR